MRALYSPRDNRARERWRSGPSGHELLRPLSVLFGGSTLSMAIGYGGTSPDVLPADLWTKLEELRKLARRESAEPGALP